jgi:SRSO17 transposase
VAKPITLTDEQRAALTKWSRGRSTPARLVLRAQIVLAADDGHLTHAPQGTSLPALVRVAGCRWAIEECFEQAKQETGLDECELRGRDGWHRHTTNDADAGLPINVEP